jgi:myo-inositol-1(or 4)-monophosphatase
MEQQLSNYLNVALEAAQIGGKAIKDSFGMSTHITMKGDVEIQTSVDLKSEKVIIDTIRKHFRDHNIISEERGRLDQGSSYTWIIDPLDGTSNFVVGIPQISVCITLVRSNDDIQLTVIHQPFLEITYYAIKNHGSWVKQRNSVESISVNTPLKKLSNSTICGIMTYSMHGNKMAQVVLNTLRDNTKRFLDTWAPALDWCLLANGKIDGLVYISEIPLSIDPGMLAGAFLFQEAGGKICNLRGETSNDLFKLESVIAANHRKMIKDLSSTIGSNSVNSLEESFSCIG